MIAYDRTAAQPALKTAFERKGREGRKVKAILLAFRR
jgi:hypothetical protein